MKTKKKIIIGSISVLSVLLLLVIIAVIVKRVNSTQAIVIPISDLATTGFYDDSGESGISGQVSDNVTQKVQVGTDDIIQEVYVKEGDQVTVGTPLMAYDMTLKKMELEIAKLTQQQQDNQLKKAEERLTSLQNGGPITEEDDSAISPGSSSPDSSTGPGGISGSDDAISSPSGPTGTSSANRQSGGFIQLSVVTPGNHVDSDMEEEDIPPMDEITGGNSSTDTTNVQAATAGENTENPSGDGAGTSSPVPDVSTRKPLDTLTSVNDALSGTGIERDPYIFYVSGIDISRTYNFAVDMIQGMKKLTAGGFYKLVYYNEEGDLIWEPKSEERLLTIYSGETSVSQLEAGSFDDATIILAGDGSAENPFVFYTQSGTPSLKGDFLQTAAIQGYSYCIAYDSSISSIHNGVDLNTEDVTDSHLYTFTNWDDLGTITDQTDTTTPDDGTSPDGSDPTDDGDGPVSDDGSVDDGTDSGITREDAIKSAQDNITTIKLSQRSTSLNISKLEKQVANEVVTAAVDGVVKVVGDPETGKSDGDAFIELQSDTGLYIKGAVSELSLDKISVDQLITGTSYESGVNFQATIRAIDPYPSTDTGNNGVGNPNVSYYEFLAYIPEDPGLRNDENVQLYVNDATAENTSEGFYIEQAFVRQEDGAYYVLKDEEGKLKKQIVQAKPASDGYLIQILSGLTLEDKIAFPYGKGIVEGAKTKDGTVDDLYGGFL